MKQKTRAERALKKNIVKQKDHLPLKGSKTQLILESSWSGCSQETQVQATANAMDHCGHSFINMQSNGTRKSSINFLNLITFIYLFIIYVGVQVVPEECQVVRLSGWHLHLLNCLTSPQGPLRQCWWKHQVGKEKHTAKWEICYRPQMLAVDSLSLSVGGN